MERGRTLWHVGGPSVPSWGMAALSLGFLCPWVPPTQGTDISEGSGSFVSPSQVRCLPLQRAGVLSEGLESSCPLPGDGSHV